MVARSAAAAPERVGWYAVALVVVAPFVAETVASANTPAVLFPLVLPVYAIVYGCPALLFRELWVRGRLTGVRLLLLGVGYTAFNEGLVAGTWFKLSPTTSKVLAFTADQAGRAFGVNWAVAVGLVVFHTVYSLIVPVVVMEAVAAVRGRGGERRPWIGRSAAVVCLVLVGLVLVGSLTPRGTAKTCAGPALADCSTGRRAVAVLALLIAVALMLLPAPRRRPAPDVRGRLPRGGGFHPDPPVHGWPSERVRPPVHTAWPLLAGAGFGLAFFTAFFGLPLLGLPSAAVVADVVLLVVVGVVGGRWCRPQARSLRDDVLVTAGALLPAMVLSLRAWQVGQPLAVAAAVALYGFVLVRLRNVAGAPVGGPPRPWPSGRRRTG